MTDEEFEKKDAAYWEREREKVDTAYADWLRQENERLIKTKAEELEERRLLIEEREKKWAELERERVEFFKSAESLKPVSKIDTSFKMYASDSPVQFEGQDPLNLSLRPDPDKYEPALTKELTVVKGAYWRKGDIPAVPLGDIHVGPNIFDKVKPLNKELARRELEGWLSVNQDYYVRSLIKGEEVDDDGRGADGADSSVE
jgi:hypothetical protein